jgi:hypothetical protein
MRRCSLVLSVLGLLALAPPARAQAGPDPLFSKYRQFEIPFQVGPGKDRLKEVRLWVSADQGKSWQYAAAAGPEQGKFNYISGNDGLLWFAVQTLDKESRPYPATMEGVTPHLRVVVDTQPPVVTLKAAPPRDGLVGVTWTIQDDNYDPAVPDALRLEFQPVGGLGWTPVIPRGLVNQAYWNPETNGPIEVRLHATDRAGNKGTATLKITPGENTGGAFQGGPAERDPAPAGDAPPDRRLINSTSINLNFEIKDRGPSGVSAIELWFTQDGRSWNKYPLPKPAEGMEIQSPLTFKVSNEGLYGFTLVAKSGVGLGERPPQVGDKPQIWVEVDMTKPVVSIQNVIVGQGKDQGKLSIYWKATDKNLGATPVALFYAEKQDGPWQPITGEKRLANSGLFVWQMPEGLPYQFHLKVEAVDRAGNVGEAVTPNLVRVDLKLPKVKITNVEPTPGGR